MAQHLIDFEPSPQLGGAGEDEEDTGVYGGFGQRIRHGLTRLYILYSIHYTLYSIQYALKLINCASEICFCGNRAKRTHREHLLNTVATVTERTVQYSICVTLYTHLDTILTD